MLHTLTRSLRENKGPALVTVLLSALEAVFEIVIPLFMSNLIDSALRAAAWRRSGSSVHFCCCWRRSSWRPACSRRAHRGACIRRLWREPA